MASVWIALKGYAPYFWREWVTGVDHKRIGVMYMPLAMLMMPRGFIDAIIMRSQQASSSVSRAEPHAKLH